MTTKKDRLRLALQAGFSFDRAWLRAGYTKKYNARVAARKLGFVAPVVPRKLIAADVVRLYREGKRPAEVAALLGTTKNTVAVIASREGVLSRKPPGRIPDAALRKALKDYFEYGFGPATIAKLVHKNPGYIYQLMSAEGFVHSRIKGVPANLIDDYRAIMRKRTFRRPEVLAMLGIKESDE